MLTEKDTKAVIFDLGNVLINVDDYPNIKKFKKYTDRKIDDEVLREQLYLTYAPKHIDENHHRLFYKYHKGQISTPQFFQKLQKIIPFHSKISFEDFCKQWPARFTLKTDVLSIVKKLYTYRRYLLSDTNELDAVWIQKEFPEIFKEFDHVFLSYEWGVLKHTKAAFQNVLHHSKLDPRNCTFIDDRKEYVKIAKSLGINGIVFKNSQHLESQLKSLGFMI